MSTFSLMNGEQLELSLHPHDGTPLSFLMALRRHFDGFNPDRAQIEKYRHRFAIVTALQRVRAHNADRYGMAMLLFPGIGTVPDVPVINAEEAEREESLCPSCLALAEPHLPGLTPTMAPDARRARGTPVSAPALSVSPLELVSCNRGLTLFPTSMSPRAMSRARFIGIQGNEALA